MKKQMKEMATKIRQLEKRVVTLEARVKEKAAALKAKSQAYRNVVKSLAKLKLTRSERVEEMTGGQYKRWPTKPASKLTTWRAKTRRNLAFREGVNHTAEKLGIPPEMRDRLIACWGPQQGCENDSARHKLERLTKMMAEHNIAQTVMGDTLKILGLSDINAASVKRVNTAQNELIYQRIKVYSNDYVTTLDVADVIREMILKLTGDKGLEKDTTFSINVMADGRSFGQFTTTLWALRFVWTEGSDSQAQEAIVPIAVLNCPEKRGPLQLLTKDLRRQLAEVQLRGVRIQPVTVVAFTPGTVIPLEAPLQAEAQPDATLWLEEPEDWSWYREELQANTERKEREGVFEEEAKRAPVASSAGFLASIVLYLSADMKFLSLSMGLSAATSRCPCPYCRARKPKKAVEEAIAALDELSDTPEEDPKAPKKKKKTKTKKRKSTMTPEEEAADAKGDWYEHLKARTITRGSWDHVEGGSTGQMKPNLMCFIPFTRVVIDVLHLHLRVSDRIYHCALEKILDHCFQLKSTKKAVTPATLLQDQTDWLNLHVAPFFQAASNVSSLQFSNKQGLWSCSRMSDGACRLINKNLKFAPILPKHLAVAQALQETLDGFVALYACINSPVAPPNPETHRSHARVWLNSVIGPRENGSHLFSHTFLTPYVHVFVHHVGELLQTHGEIYTFSGQALERANGRHGFVSADAPADRWFTHSINRRGLAANQFSARGRAEPRNHHGDV
jgi:hypothetical protein